VSNSLALAAWNAPLKITIRIYAVLLAGIALAVSAGAGAAARVSRIRYAEPVDLPGVPSLASGLGKPTASARTRFEAFGRRFELQLESNDRVLRKLPSADRAALPTHALYGGTVVGLPGSWVRLTRLNNGVQGLIYDGNELYVLAPAGAVQGELDVPLPGIAKSATLIYRAADVDGGLGPDFCRVLQPPTGGAASGGGASPEPAYKAIFAELKANAGAIAAALPTKELDLALVGDTQLAAAIPGTTGEMLARLNNVDGIFSAQVGVKVTSGFVKVLTSDAGMTATAADVLLDQFDAYRKVTPEAAAHGVAHLMTGRELDGSTVGIAYLGTLCAAKFAVSLSQTYLDTFYSSLVAAHELGHNFGAPHDGLSGSACATTPQTYLMSPAINGSSTFSPCSLDQIAPVVRAAKCLTAPSVADVAVEFAASSLSGYTKQDTHVPVSVVSAGNAGVDQVVLTVNAPGPLTVLGASVTGGTCTWDSVSATCQLGSMAVGTRRTVDLVVRGLVPTSVPLSANVRASVDADPGNNDATATLTFSSPADGSVTVSSSPVSAYLGETESFSITASNAGPLPLENASVEIQHSIVFAVVSAGGTGAVCAKSTFGTTCTLGTLAAGESRRIDFGVVSARAWGETMQVSILSDNDDVGINNVAYVTVRALPLVELALAAEPGPSIIRVGGTATQSFTLHSLGPQAVNGASFTLEPSSEIEILSVSGTGAACAPLGNAPRSFGCTYGSPIESGGSRRLDATLKGLSSVSGAVIAVISAPDSQHLPGSAADSIRLVYEVRSDVDLRLSALFSSAVAYDHRAATLTFDVDSIGVTPAANSHFSLSLPANLRATKAQATVGSCSISTASVDCPLGSLAAGASSRIQVDVVSDVTGTYTVNAQATADGDTDPSDGSSQVRLDVRPNVDLSIAPLPAVTHVRAGATIDYPVTVAAAGQPVPGATVSFSVGSGVTVLGATPSQGSCEPPSSFFHCALGTVAANGAATVTLRLRGESATSVALSIRATGSGDIDPGDGLGAATLVVDAQGNVSVQSAAASVTATVGSAFDYPRITVNALARTDDVRVGLTIPAAFSIDSATADSAPCSVNAGSIDCSFGTLEAGSSRGINVRLRPNQSGAYSTQVTATAAYDSDTSNNSANISITVSRAASRVGGGGGGGAFDPQAALMLLLLAPAALRRRRTDPGRTTSSCDRRGRRCAK